MPQSFVNPYSGQEEETCSVSFASQAHVASVHDAQTEAQFHRSKLLGEFGVIKAKAAKDQIPSGTKVLSFEGTNVRGYFYVKGKKLYVRRYRKSDGKQLGDTLLSDSTAKAYFGLNDFKWSIPQSVLPKQDQADTIHKLTGWNPDEFILSSYWAAVTKNKKAGKIAPGTVVAVNPDYQTRLVYKGSSAKDVYSIEGANDDGDWSHIEYVEYPQQVTNLFDEGWYTPPETETVAPPHAAPSQAKLLTKKEASDIQQSEDLKEGDLLAVSSSPSGITKYRIVMGKEDAAEPFLMLAKGPNNATFVQIDKGDWFPDLIDDGNKWYEPSKDPEPVAAPTPKPPVSQGSTSAGSMSDEDVATLFVQIKDQMATEQGINIKGSNPELDALVYKAIGDQVGYTATEVKAKIDAYKASGKKLSALKKKVLKKGPQPTAKPKPVDPDPSPMPNNVPTAATPEVVEGVVAAVTPAVDKSLYSNEDIAGAYVVAKDQIVAASNGKWTLYTKSDEMDALIYGNILLKTGFKQAEAKHAIAVYLSDPGNKLSKLKKSLIKQGKLKPEADTLKKKKTSAEVQADINSKAEQGYTPPAQPTSGTASPADTSKPATVNEAAKPTKKDKELHEQAGDTGHIGQVSQQKIFDQFKALGSQSWLSSGPGSNYDGFVQVLVDMKATMGNEDLTLLQVIRVVDQKGADKAGVDNGHLFEKAVVQFLTTPEGKKHIEDSKLKALKMAEEAKKKAETAKLVEQYKANMPPLPADSKLFTNIEESEVRKWQASQRPWTDSQKSSLRHYTSNQGYSEMNGNLRESGYQNDRVVKHVKEAREGMRPIDRPFTAHRGTTAVSFGLSDNGNENDLLYGLVGTKHKQVGFSSASFGSRAGFGSKPVIVHFECPPGMPAAYVKDISHFQHENEILLDHNLEVRILRVWETDSGWSRQFHVQVRVEGWEGKQ